MQLLLVQRAHGGLTIGDTHEYAEPFGFDVQSDPYDYLAQAVESILGQKLPPIVRRWAGRLLPVHPGRDRRPANRRRQRHPRHRTGWSRHDDGARDRRDDLPGGRTVSGIQLVVLDMAGTTVADDGLVEQAFTQR